MQKNFTLSLCALVAVLIVMPASAMAQGTSETATQATPDMSWLPAVGADGVIRWGATRARQDLPPIFERRAVPNAFRIEAVEMRGGFIVLEDGTRWEVFLPHRPGTAVWQPGDHVLVQPAPVRRGRRGAHAYRLENGERDYVAAVRFAGVTTVPVPPAWSPPAP